MKTELAIIGGGFAGIQACNSLRRSEISAVLIEKNLHTTIFPALPDLAGGWIPPDIVQHPIADLLPPNVSFWQGEVTSIDLENRSLVVGADTVSYQQLLIAAGSIPNFYNTSFPRERLYGLGSLADALRIRADFLEYLGQTPRLHLLVAGTGYTGLELAMSLFFRAKALKKDCRVTIVDPTPVLLPSLPENQRRYVLRFLARQGVKVKLNTGVATFDGRNAAVDGDIYNNVFFCWAAGSKFAIPEIKGQVNRLSDGRLTVNPDLSLPGYPEVFVAGDSAAFLRNGRPLRKAVNFAFYGGRHAGANILRRRRKLPTRPFHPVDLGWIVPFHATSIGHLPGNVWLHGRLGVRLHHLMCGVRNYSFSNFRGFLRQAWNPYPKGATS